MAKVDFESKKERIAEIAKKHGLTFVALFGSQATGRLHEKSDIDIGVAKRAASYFEEAPSSVIELEREFSVVLNREDVEVVDLNNSSPALMRSAVEDGKLLYESESGAFYEWKLFAARVWMETYWMRQRAREHLKDWAEQL